MRTRAKVRGVRSVAQLVQIVAARSMHMYIRTPVTPDDVFLVNVITRDRTPQPGNPANVYQYAASLVEWMSLMQAAHFRSPLTVHISG